MKKFKNPIRVFDNKTLEYKGIYNSGYKSGEIGVFEDGDVVFDKSWIRGFSIIIVTVFACLFIMMAIFNNKYVKYKNECKLLEERIEVAEFDNNLEALAGRYATARIPIPTDMNEVYKVCVESGAWYPEVIMAQFIIESGSGTSRLARQANNCYGMKKVGSKGRPNLQVPNDAKNGYGVYLNWQHSILDRVLWDEWFFKKTRPGSIDEYLERIDGIYAEDPNYIAKVKNIMKDWVE